MVRRNDDLAEVHRYVLQLLAQDLGLVGHSRLELSPTCITRNIGYRDNDYVGQSCRELAAYGLVERAEDGPYYRITDDGLAYVAGDLDLEDIQD